MQIWMKIIIGMILGVLIGYFFGANSPFEYFNGELGTTLIGFFNIVGEIFLKLLKMIVVPLIFFSLCIGIASMENISEIGSAGIKLLAYFMLTTAIAIIIGVTLSSIIRPGSYVNQDKRDAIMHENQGNAEKYKQNARAQTGNDSANARELESERGVFGALRKGARLLKKNLLEMIPANPIEAMADTRILQIIVFAIFFGIGITNLNPDHKEFILRFCHVVNDIMIFLVQMIMSIAPFGVCTLMAYSVSKVGLSVMAALAVYALTVITGLFLHLMIVYLPVARFSSGRNPIDFLMQIKEALILAFSTSSSSATLPVTMKCVDENLKVPTKTSSFVLPLGATVNMDGTALYQGVAVVFIAQVFGYSLSVGDLVSIVLMATLASIGAAGVPGAGMITLVMVLDTVNPELVAGVALVMGVDRFLDMVRTTVNVTGDSTACCLMDWLNRGNEARSNALSNT